MYVDKRQLMPLFVNHNLAVELKALGFDEPCLAILFPDNQIEYGAPEFINVMLRRDVEAIKAPMIQQAVDWLREKHGLVVDVFQEFNGTDAYTGKWELDISKLRKYESPHEIEVDELFDEPYPGWIKGIKTVVEYIKEKNQPA